MKVEGTITRINYYNKVNGYGVVIISLKDEDYKTLQNPSKYKQKDDGREY